MAEKEANAAEGGRRRSTARHQRPARRPEKPADPAYLERAALHYLERFATTRGHLAQVLRRKIRRRGLPEGVADSEAEEWIAALVEKLVRLGYVDDLGFARARAQSLLNRGRPLRAVRQGLAEKSVPAGMIDQVLAETVEESANTDLLAAVRYVRRRRIGPARPAPPADADAAHKAFQRDMAALARAGFSYDIARQVLEAHGPEGLNELEDEAGA